MPTTTNFGWTTPADTDLVKDGAAAIRTLGNGIDTSLLDLKGGTTGQVLAKASNTDLDFTWATDASGISATIFDAKGDLIAASAADTAARLAVGANDTVLTADSSTATGLKWATVSTPAKTYTLINAGGTALTGASTITVSSIGNYNDYLFWVSGASSVNIATFTMRFNSDSGSNYQVISEIVSAGGPSITVGSDDAATSITLGDTTPGAGVGVNCYLELRGGNSTGVKPYNHSSIRTNGGEWRFYQGLYKGTSAISSVSIISSSGNFDAGTIYVYGA